MNPIDFDVHKWVPRFWPMAICLNLDVYYVDVHWWPLLLIQVFEGRSWRRAGERIERTVSCTKGQQKLRGFPQVVVSGTNLRVSLVRKGQCPMQDAVLLARHGFKWLNILNILKHLKTLRMGRFSGTHLHQVWWQCHLGWASCMNFVAPLQPSGRTPLQNVLFFWVAQWWFTPTKLCLSLVGGLEHFLFFHILGIIIPID